MSELRAVLKHLSTGSENVIDPAFAKRCGELADREAEATADDLIDLLDDGARYALAGDLAMMVLDGHWRLLGGDNHQANRRRAERIKAEGA